LWDYYSTQDRQQQQQQQTRKKMKMKDKIESALILGTSLVAIGALALWGAWLMACMAIS